MLPHPCWNYTKFYLARTLGDIHRVEDETPIQGAINATIELGLTNVNNAGEDTLSLEDLFRAIEGNPDEAEEHDSSFVREDFGQEGVDNRKPSPKTHQTII